MNGKIIAVIVAVLAIGAVGWYLQRDATEDDRVETALPQPEPQATELGEVERDDAAQETASEVAVLPPPTLDESDEPVRSAAADLATRLAAWVTPEEQVRKWVLLVDMAADGKVPARNRPLNYPMATFKASETDEEQYRFDTANYGRTGELVEVLVNIPPQKVADYYRVWHPLLQQAYAELGKPDSFDERLRLAIERVLAAQPLPAPPELERPNVFYTYADPAREKASDLDKLLWRLGPDNTQRLQNYLREVQSHL